MISTVATICPKCGGEVDQVAYQLTGQSMCLKCGSVVDIFSLTNKEDEDNDRVENFR